MFEEKGFVFSFLQTKNEKIKEKVAKELHQEKVSSIKLSDCEEVIFDSEDDCEKETKKGVQKVIGMEVFSLEDEVKERNKVLEDVTVIGVLFIDGQKNSLQDLAVKSFAIAGQEKIEVHYSIS